MAPEMDRSHGSRTASHWIVFAGVSGFVFGYQLHDFWRFRATGRFWIALLLLFACHFALWVFYVHPILVRTLGCSLGS